MSLSSVSVQPSNGTSSRPGLSSSIHSSLVEANVPAQATSLMMTASGANGVAGGGASVGVGEGVGVVKGIDGAFGWRGVPAIGRPSASRPLPPTPGNVLQLPGTSSAPCRSMLARAVVSPAGHAPPAALAVSMSSPEGSISSSVSPPLLRLPVYTPSAEISATVWSFVRSRRYSPKGAISPCSPASRSPPSLRVHPSSAIGSGPVFHNSIHSSLVEANVPAQATSLIRTAPGLKDGASACAAPRTVSGVGVAVRVAAGVVGVSVGDAVAAGVSVAVGSGAVGDSTVGEGEASVGVELIGAGVALAVSVPPNGEASVDVGSTPVDVEAGVPVASGGPAVAGGAAEETGDGSAVEEGGAGDSLGGAVASVCVGTSNPVIVAGRSSDGGEADVGTESRPAASTSHASKPARAKRRRWAIVFPPGPANCNHSTRLKVASQSPGGVSAIPHD